MITVADYIMNAAVEYGIRHCFTVPGGHCQYLSEAADFHSELEVVYFHHEQAAAVAASAYFHANKTPAMVLVTAGPGVMNALAGVAAAWLDGVPMLVVSGQMKRESLGAVERPRFTPEVSTIAIVEPITCFARMIENPDEITYYFADAMAIAQHMNGSGGPVWLDIPLDIQSTEL